MRKTGLDPSSSCIVADRSAMLRIGGAGAGKSIGYATRPLVAMATPFSRTLRSLRADGAARSTSALAIGAVVLGVWATWMLEANLAVYVESAEARIEVDQLPHPLQAPVGGRIVSLE